MFGGTGGESVPDWMTAIHQALANTPPAFRTTVNRALNTAVSTDATFNVMMAEEAENIAQAAQPAPQNRGVRIMTPEEQTAALSLSALRGGSAQPRTNGAPAADPNASPSPANAPTSPAGNSANQPVPAATPTLIEGLRKVAEDQAEDEEILADMEIQGSKKPTNLEPIREFVGLQDELFVMIAMMDGPFVQPLHSFIKYAALGRRPCQYNGVHMAAVGDRVGLADPPYTKVRKSYFEWTKGKPVKDTSDTGPIATFYDDVNNRMKPFIPSSDINIELDSEVGFPKMPMIPAEVAVIVASVPTTPWELHAHLVDYENDRDEKVKEMLAPVKAWALMASCSKTSKELSSVAFVFPSVTMPSKALQNKLKTRLNTTLGTRPSQAQIPACSPPNGFTTMSPQQVAAAAVASMSAAQPSAADIGGIFQQGVATTMRMYQELQSNDSGYKKFSDIQKGALLGFCGEVTWANVHPIWKTIESTKNDADLRRILDTEWAVHAKNINLMHYQVFWTDELLSAIRTVEFTEAGKATFLTSELGLSILQLMPRTTEEEGRMNAVRRAKAKAGGIISYAEARKFERAPRLPPRTWEETATLLLTYSLFLEMLFGRKNEHLDGVQAVRRNLMALAQCKSKLKPSYYGNVIWAVLDDMAKHFSECMSIDDFATARFGLMWPRTDLRGFAQQMSGNQDINLITLPDEWVESWAPTRQYERDQHNRDRGGRGRGGGGGRGLGSGGGGGGLRDDRPPGKTPRNDRDRGRGDGHREWSVQ